MVAVVFIDLDDFKAVNDTLGHNAGDRVLKEVAARISSCIREGDLAARLGGDEFVMVLPLQPGQETLAPMMQRVLDSVSRAIRIGNRKVSVGCSMGAAIYPRDGKDSESLMRGADTAMYRVKEHSRSNLELFNTESGASQPPARKVESL
jgi:diguanylate cyclase (GGDEF)-like protein